MSRKAAIAGPGREQQHSRERDRHRDGVDPGESDRPEQQPGIPSHHQAAIGDRAPAGQQHRERRRVDDHHEAQPGARVQQPGRRPTAAIIGTSATIGYTQAVSMPTQSPASVPLLDPPLVEVDVTHRQTGGEQAEQPEPEMHEHERAPEGDRMREEAPRGRRVCRRRAGRHPSWFQTMTRPMRARTRPGQDGSTQHPRRNHVPPSPSGSAPSVAAAALRARAQRLRRQRRGAERPRVRLRHRRQAHDRHRRARLLPVRHRRRPASGEGFEAAIAYAVAEELGFDAEDVVWVRTGFDEVIAPGPKNFDFNLQQFSITDERKQQVDFSLAVLRGDPGRHHRRGLGRGRRDVDRRPQGPADRRRNRHDEPRRPSRRPSSPPRAPRCSTTTTTPSSPSRAARSTRSSSTCPPRSTSRGVELEGGVIVGQLPAAGGHQRRVGPAAREGQPADGEVTAAVDALRESGTLDEIADAVARSGCRSSRPELAVD